MPHDPHQHFQELCAISTTEELTREEWMHLSEHLACCDICADTRRQYQHLISTAIPALAVESGAYEDVESAPGSWSIEQAEDTLMVSLRDERAPSINRPVFPHPSPGWRRTRRYAAAAILVAWGFVSYRIGIEQSRRMAASVMPAALPEPSKALLVHQSAPIPSAEDKTASSEDEAALRSQARQSLQELTRTKVKLELVEEELAERSANLDHSIEDRSELSRQLAQAQANAENLETRLRGLGDQSSQTALQQLALKTQVDDLKTEIEEKDRAIVKDRELLDRDRDVRNLIGARNLYIAEIYDVAQTGDTQKPFGRVFYTEDKSLIFYGYDLDRQPGAKRAAAFQAWGGRGADRQQAVSLGLLFRDDANQKRWILKCNDAKTISQIDAVFVTVEPEGGSQKPTGKPLLFTYLRLDPNHP